MSDGRRTVKADEQCCDGGHGTQSSGAIDAAARAAPRSIAASGVVPPTSLPYAKHPRPGYFDTDPSAASRDTHSDVCVCSMCAQRRPVYLPRRSAPFHPRVPPPRCCRRCPCGQHSLFGCHISESNTILGGSRGYSCSSASPSSCHQCEWASARSWASPRPPPTASMLTGGKMRRAFRIAPSQSVSVGLASAPGPCDMSSPHDHDGPLEDVVVVDQPGTESVHGVALEV